jgi:hypothetical protein
MFPVPSYGEKETKENKRKKKKVKKEEHKGSLFYLFIN